MIEPGFDTARLLLRLRQEGITHGGVMRAVEKVHRAEYIDEPALKPLAGGDTLLPIACGQVIPRPSTAGRMLQALDMPQEPGARMLLLGIEAGYLAALAAEMGAVVHAVERYLTLIGAARNRFERLGIRPAALHHGDPAAGLPGSGPFDCILIPAAVREIPACLLQQLAPGGALVAAEAGDRTQNLLKVDAGGGAVRAALADTLPPFLHGRAHTL